MNALEAWEANERFRLSGRRQDDLEEFGRIANPSGRINVPVTDPYNDDATNAEEHWIIPAGDATVMPGLPDWPLDTSLGYPFTENMEDTDAASHPAHADSVEPARGETPASPNKPREEPQARPAAVVGESVTVIGNLVADPRLKELGDGSVVANFTIASTPRIFDEDTRQWKDAETVFHRASAWNATARHADASLTKGSRVIAVGRIKSRTFEGKDGRMRAVQELVVEDIAVSLRFHAATVDQGRQRRQEDRAAG